jgi:intein-encoded DNA endonuclease-like protein
MSGKKKVSNMPVTDRIEIFKKAKKLDKKDKSIVEISEELNVKYGSIANWISSDKSPLNRYSIPNLEKIKDVSFILGSLKGDGSTRKKDWRLSLRVNDKEFADSFSRSINNIGLGSTQCKVGKRYCVETYSRYFYEWYHSQTINQIKKYTDSINFIRGFYDAEGSLIINNNGYPRIQITNYSFKLIKLICEMLKSLDFDVTLKTYDSKKFQLWTLGGKEEVIRFCETVQPTITRKTWRGKNERAS